VTRIMQQIGGSFGTAVLAVILVGHSFAVTFWWSVAVTGLAMLPALILPGQSRAAALGRVAAGVAARAGVPVRVAAGGIPPAIGADRRTELAEPVRAPGRSPG